MQNLLRAVDMMFKLKMAFPNSTFPQLYNAMVYLLLLYIKTVWGSTYYTSYLKKLEVLQNTK